MYIDSFDCNEKVLIIAEIGVNHEGSYTLAEELLMKAVEAGADAVKFQTFQVDHYISSFLAPARYERAKRFMLTYKEFEKLSKLAKDNNLIFLSTPLDLESVAFLNTIVPAFKVASGDNSFFPLLDAIARTGKPVIMSGGLSTVEQLRYSKSFIENIWATTTQSSDIALLHCVASYPVQVEEANLMAISQFKQNFDCTIGYSDHVFGIKAALAAAALGARIIEKHFTISKTYSDFRDHQLSAEPEELKAMVEGIREISKLLGSEGRKIQDGEKNILASMRRAIVARHVIEAGQTITWNDITWTRPGEGIAPGQEHMLLGRRARILLVAGEPIMPEKLY